MRPTVLLCCLPVLFVSCARDNHQTDSDLPKTDIIEQGEADLPREKLLSLDFKIKTGEELRLEANIICSDLKSYENATWYLSDKEQLTGQGISLSYLNAGTKYIKLICNGKGESLEKRISIVVSESSPEIISCAACADVENTACDLKSLDNEGDIWRKSQTSCWQSNDGFVDAVEEASDEVNGESGDADWTQNDSVTSNNDDIASQNEDGIGNQN